MRIRPATVADADALARLELRTALFAYADIWPAEAPTPTVKGLTVRWQARLDRDDLQAAGFVACLDSSDESIIGGVIAQPDPSAAGRGHLLGLYVDPKHWGQGVGGMLHDAALAHLHRVGLSPVALWVLEDNLRARAWYERRRWELTGRRKAIWKRVEEVEYLVHLGRMDDQS